MPDWARFVRERLELPGLDPTREAEIREDVALQLAEAYRDALASGATEAEAFAEVSGHVPDWKEFARQLRKSERRHLRPLEERTANFIADRRLERPGGASMMLDLVFDLIRDSLHGIRLMRKSPTFTAISVLTLGLGIAATTTVFSLVDGLLWRPLPVATPGELVALAVSDYHTDFPHGLSYRDYLDLRRDKQVFSDLLLYAPVQGNLIAEGEAEVTWGQVVTHNYFEMLGVKPFLGSTFPDSPEPTWRGGGAPRQEPEAENESPGAQPYLVLSHGFWARRYGRDTGIVGKNVVLNRQSFTVTGVMPEEFTGLEVMFSPDFWAPVMMFETVMRVPQSLLEDREQHRFRAWARLAHGVPFERAQAALNVRTEELAREYPAASRAIQIRLFPSWEARLEAGTGRMYVLATGLLLAVAAMVLLIACANVANLFLARGAARRREMALRVAIGAGRGRLVRQLLAEGVVLAFVSALVALLLAYGATALLSQIRFSGVPLKFDFRMDLRAFTATGLLALLTTLVFGLVPALRASRPELIPSLKGEEAGLGVNERRLSLRNVLAVAQVASALLLLVGAGLFMRTLYNIERADLGLRGKDMVLATLNLSLQGYDEARGRQFQQSLLARVRGLAGVDSASLGWPVPLDFFATGTNVFIAGREAPPEKEQVGIMTSYVASDYFETVGTRILEGRGFTEADVVASPRVAVVNETLARHYWPGESALGKRFFVDARDGEEVEIVGVAQGGKYRMYFEPPQDYLYIPLTQHYTGTMTLVVHSGMALGPLVSALRREVQALEPSLPLVGVRTIEEYLRGRTFVGPRLLTSFLSAFGLIGLTLATVGVYGVIAYSVSQRTREIGIRLALGAEPGEVLRMVVRQGVVLAGVGIGIGLVGAAVLTRLVGTMLYGVSPTDPLTFVGITLVLLLGALWASVTPARRAMRVDPNTALRYE